ncbi:MAG: hypothetical protein WBB45_17380 [Cyclobacteriaceae bacterium]
MKNHIKIVGILYILLSVAFTIAAAYFITGVSADFGPMEELDEGFSLMTGIFISAYFLVLGLPGIIAGIGLLRYKNWARHMIIILSVLNLLNFPLGTILGIYSLWVTTHGGTKALTRVYSLAAS